MRLLRLRRLGFMFWLGLLALAAAGVAQNQLSTNVLVAALTDDTAAHGHMMPDGSFMPGTMAHAAHDAAHTGGHTHKGHSDCALCGAVAGMAALSVAFTPVVTTPPIYAASVFWAPAQYGLSAAPRSSYSSRAPPIPMG